MCLFHWEFTGLIHTTFGQAMILVGGFAESQYLQSVILSRLRKGIKQINVDEATCVLPWHKYWLLYK